jgi:protein gp37
MKNSSIQWTHHTYNPWLGCRKVAPECDNCYIIHQTPLRVRNIVHGSERHRCADSTLRQPFVWNRAAENAGERHRVFCLSLGDWADGEVPDEWRDKLLQTIRETPSLDWLLLTKRPKLAARYISSVPINVWLGVSAGVDPVPLFDIEARTYFLSCEPMLRPLGQTAKDLPFDWIIFGFESGPHARIGNDEWIRDGINHCRDNGIAPFVKQLGTNPRFKDSHGGDMSEWPEDLRIREFPES